MSLRIKEVLKHYDISQKEVSKKSGISEVMLSYYNSGEKKPPLEKLKMIADTIGCHLFELMDSGKDYAHFYDPTTNDWLGVRRK